MAGAPLSVQVGAGDLDGFQADTEEEEEEDGDSVILDISDVGGEKGPTLLFHQPGRKGRMHALSFPYTTCL